MEVILRAHGQSISHAAWQGEGIAWRQGRAGRLVAASVSSQQWSGSTQQGAIRWMLECQLMPHPNQAWQPGTSTGMSHAMLSCIWAATCWVVLCTSRLPVQRAVLSCLPADLRRFRDSASPIPPNMAKHRPAHIQCQAQLHSLPVLPARCTHFCMCKPWPLHPLQYVFSLQRACFANLHAGSGADPQ